MEQLELNIKLSVDEINVVLETLNNLPIYKMIGSTIGKIQSQAQEQVQALQQTQETITEDVVETN